MSRIRPRKLGSPPLGCGLALLGSGLTHWRQKKTFSARVRSGRAVGERVALARRRAHSAPIILRAHVVTVEVYLPNPALYSASSSTISFSNSISRLFLPSPLRHELRCSRSLASSAISSSLRLI